MQKKKKKKKKKSERAFCFSYNGIWIDCVNLSQSRSEYMPLTVNVFKKSHKILHITKRDFFQLTFFEIDQ